MTLSLQDKLDQAYSSVELLPTFVRTKNGEFPAGKAIFDKQQGVISQVSDNHFFVPNKELIDKLKSFYKIKITDVHINKSRNTFYFNGYFPDIYFTDHNGITLFVGFELGNSYSNRFLPYATFSAYNFKHETYIRTHLPAMQITRKNWEDDNIDFEEDNVNVIKLIPEAQSMQTTHFYDTLETLPQKYYYYAERNIETYTSLYSQNIYSYLLWLAEVVKRWGKFNYEVAVKFQKEKYTRSIV